MVARWATRSPQVADTAAAEGRQITAGNNYMRAGNYYYSAERFIPPGPEKMAMYRKALRCYHAALERLHPNVERVDVPYEGKSLAAYFMKAPGVTGRAPTVVLFDGMDNCKEMSVIFAGIEFAKRGIHTLSIDGPGQGETQRLRNIHSRHDYEVPGTAAYDYVAARPDVDPKRVAVMGYSFGGYHAPRIVAFEKRYAACVAFGAMHWSIYDWLAEARRRGSRAMPRRASRRTSSSAGWSARPTTRPRSNGRRASRWKAWPQRIECAVPGAARRERSDRAARGGEEAVRAGRLEATSTSRSSPSRKAAPSIARSITARWASTTSATGCSRTCSARGGAKKRRTAADREELSCCRSSDHS